MKIWAIGFFILNGIIFCLGLTISALIIATSLGFVEMAEEMNHHRSKQLKFWTIMQGFTLSTTAIIGCLVVNSSWRLLRWFYILVAGINFFSLLIIFCLNIFYQIREHDELCNNLLKSMGRYEKSDMDTTFWDRMQSNLECCGVALDAKKKKGYESWVVMNRHFNETYKIPHSCCINLSRRCTLNPTKDEVFQMDCHHILQKKIHNRMLIFGGTSVSALIILALLACVHKCLIRRRQKKKAERAYRKSIEKAVMKEKIEKKGRK